MNPERHDARRRHHTMVAAAGVALLVAGGSAVAWATTQQVGPPPAPPAATSTAGQEFATSSTPAPEKTTQPSPPPVSAVESMPASRPIAVRIPAIDVDSPIHGLGLDEQGKLKVPSGERYNEVAWYDGSPTPGEAGPAVLEGHVTGTNYSPSVFFKLGDMRKGDRIEVDRADGTTATFEVTEVKSAPKADFPRIDVYGATEGPELRVITCGGTFNEETGHHLDNVIVFAKLVKA